MRTRVKKWLRGMALLGAGAVVVFMFGVIPVGGSLLITNLRMPVRGSTQPPDRLPVEPVRFVSSDSVQLSGWWSPQPVDLHGTIVFVHGLNRSREEMLERAVAAYERGYSILLFDLRNHGSSGDAYTTLGVFESRDVCAAADFVRSRRPASPVVLWGVSLGASTALLGARCAEAAAVISDSSFLSFEETVKHHFRQLFRLPSFPIADLLILVTRLRMNFSLSDGDVEAAVEVLPDVPILFIAGGDDWRMPPDLARQLRAASQHPESQLLIIDGASHGRAYEHDPERYVDTSMEFLAHVLP